MLGSTTTEVGGASTPELEIDVQQDQLQVFPGAWNNGV